MNTVEYNGIELVRSALVRPTDPAEAKYARAKVAPPPSAANLNEAVSLVTPSFDPRPPIFYQGAIGSCASCSACSAVYTARNVARKRLGQKPDAKQFNPAPLYYMARKRHGWETQDTGSYLADNLDLLLEDGPLLTPDSPYIADHTRAYSEADWQRDPTNYDYEKSHQPFYDFLLENVWLALKEGLPVQLGAYWPNAWFSPSGGRLPEGIQFNPNDGGHAFFAWGYVPGFVLCDNTWSDGWAPDAALFGHQMRAGSFAIPASYFVKGGPVFEGRAVSPEPVIGPQPDPEPDPQPPTPDIRKQMIDAAEGAKASILQTEPRAKIKRWQVEGIDQAIAAMKEV